MAFTDMSLEKSRHARSTEDAVNGVATSEEGSNHVFIDPEIEKRLVWKQDLFILPFVFITYMFSFLDRINIGNAKTAGLMTDLHLVGNQINIAVSIFYVTYIIFELPGAIFMKRIGANRFISICVCGWSLVTTFSGFEQSAGALIACRLLLGVCEAALLPSINLYLAMFWTREEIAKRSSVIFVALTMAGAFGGLFAYGLLQIDAGGYAGWRWLFFIEGAVTFVVGVCLYFVFPSSPETAYFLTAEEKKVARLRMGMETAAGAETIDWSQVKAGLTSSVCWLSGITQMFADVYNYSISTFLPTVIQGLGYKGLSIQYMTIPIYVLGSVCIFGFAALSDRLQRRAPIMLVCSLFTVTGYAILLGTPDHKAGYAACYLIMIGGNAIPCLNIVWINGNSAPHYKRATALALNQIVGNIGGIVSGQIYLTAESPRYKTGQATALSCCLASWVCTWLLLALLHRKNQEKARKVRDGAPDTGVGDASIHFKYQL
ncbi:Major facilitator superfamily domain, general substrate transporter [Niveomyces insectorum RCEF 264]|uniref:Major facilitator superfamily domain, general substrate transporter n=1 Tax=Niveomyces insectorum RCEF 264 TaxID=1081102 RepID=A0A167TXF9_9HYPO|nr:Major facilitator superfamily domain, general substrate transporter [Niveomyces insectorum RCEF 264]